MMISSNKPVVTSMTPKNVGVRFQNFVSVEAEEYTMTCQNEVVSSCKGCAFIDDKNKFSPLCILSNTRAVDCTESNIIWKEVK